MNLQARFDLESARGVGRQGRSRGSTANGGLTDGPFQPVDNYYLLRLQQNHPKKARFS
jgi:hypothetical protein